GAGGGGSRVVAAVWYRSSDSTPSPVPPATSVSRTASGAATPSPSPTPNPPIVPPSPAPTPPPQTAVPLVPVAVDSVPWTRVTIRPVSSDIRIDAVERTTPFTVALPVGAYTFQPVSDQVAAPVTQQVRVVAGRPNRVVITLPSYDPDRVLSTILGPR